MAAKLEDVYLPSFEQWNELVTDWIPRLASEVLSSHYVDSDGGRAFSVVLCEGSLVRYDEPSHHVYKAEFDVCGTRTGLVEFARLPRMVSQSPRTRFSGAFRTSTGYVYASTAMRIAHNKPIWRIDPASGRAFLQIRSRHPDKLGRSTCTLTYDSAKDSYFFPFIKTPVPRETLHSALKTRALEELSAVIGRPLDAIERLLRHECLPHLGANPLDKLAYLQRVHAERPAVSDNTCDMRFVEFESVALQFCQLLRQTFTRCAKLISRALIRRAARLRAQDAEPVCGARPVVPITFKPTRAEARAIANFAPINTAIQKGITTGKWEKRQGVTHRLITSNDLMIIYQLRRVLTTYLQSPGRVIEPRMLHSADRTDYTFGYLCAVNSADGKDCGLTLELGSTAILRGLQLLRPVLVNGKKTWMAHNEQLPLGSYSEFDQQAYLGIVARQAPFGNCDQGPRSILGCVMSRQFISADVIHPEAATIYHCDYAQRNLSQLQSNAMTNLVVWIMVYGDNEEDGAAVSQRFVDLGGLACSVTKTTRKPKPETLLSDPRARSAQGFCVVGGEQLSPEVRLRDEFTGLAISETDTAIRVRTRQPLQQGDKVSNLHGQKSTISRVIPMEDLPFSVRTGMTPDLIIHPAALTSRMTAGMLLEMLAGAAHACNPNGEKLTTQNVPEVLRAAGLTSNGTERVCDGTTGEMTEAEVFTGLVSYGRMEQIAVFKSNIHTTGPRDVGTRQPHAGRSKDGAPKAGPMELDAMTAHGATAVLAERTCHVSDETRRRWCKVCAIEIHGMACGHCRNPANTRIITVPHSTMALRAELAADGVMMKCLLRDVKRKHV